MEPGRRVLQVLLDAAPEWREANGLSRPKAVCDYQALCGLWRPGEAAEGGLCFTGLCQDAGRFCQRTVAAATGKFTDFVWETTENLQTSPNSGRLLAVSNHNDLGIYNFQVQDGICDVTNTHSCSEEALKKLVEKKHLSLPPSFTLKILSFKSSTSFILLDNCTLLHLSWLEDAAEADILDAFRLCLPPEVPARITDCQICQEILFLLDTAGCIYICDTVDGKQLGNVDLKLCQAGVNEEDDEPCDLTHLSRLDLSPDLDVAVAVNCFNCAICINLNSFFREHPDHLQRASKDYNDESLRAPAGIDEDDLASSLYSDKVLNFPFQTDRSWTAQLRAFYNKTKVSPEEKFLTKSFTPWYHYLSSWKSNATPCHTSSRQSNGFGHEEGLNRQENKWFRIFQLQGLKESMSIETVSVSGFSVLFTLVAADSEAMTIAFWDLETEGVTYHHIDGHSLPVEGGGKDELCLFLTDAGLSMVVFGFSQEDLLNRLMIYGKAGIVDSLCHLNKWNRCSIPIHSLEAGIENRQLDMVDFFLKSKENLFYAPAGFLKQENSGAALASCKQLKNVEEIKPALDLLCSAIKEHDSETQSRQFSEQLLSLTLTFLNKQIQELLMQPGELDEHKQKCVDCLTGYIVRLRKFMKKYPQMPPKESITDGCEDGEGALPDDNQVYEKWKSLSTNEVIRDAILSNQIPRAQAYFRAQQEPAKNLNELMQVGLTLIYDCLLKKDLQEAKKLLKNMGFDVKKELHRICCFTADRDLRDFLVESLQDYLSDEEKEMIRFVHFLENLYSSSAHTVESPLSSSLLQVEDIDPKYSAVLEQVLSCEVGAGEPRSPNSCMVILDWAKWWDNIAKERICLSRKSETAFQSCSPEVLWTYHTSRHSWDKISNWIEAFQSSELSASWPTLTAEIVNQNTYCSSYMRNEILDKLARKQVFIPSERADFGQLLARLSGTGGVMQNPRLVPEYRSSEGLDFHGCFILYCLKHELRYLLYTYLDYYGLKPSNCPLLDDGALHVAHPWFEFLMRIREVADNPADTSVAFQASLANAQMLIPSNQASVSSMLLEGHTLMALATIMFAPGGIDRVMQRKEDVGDSLWKVDPQLLKMALSPYPRLRAALFPQITPHGIPPPDISLYHLLQSLHPFDPSRLFGWQSANLLSTCDFSNDLPHFSCPDLVNKYAITERLDFSYYLQHGRPSYAFATFLVQQLVKSSSPKQLIQRVSMEAHTLGLAHFTIPAVAAACTAFLELLGAGSFKLRIDLKVANVILKHWCANTDETRNSSLQHTLAEKLQNLVVGNRSSAEELLTHLENATWEIIQRKNIKRVSFEAGQEWSLMAQFCKLHGITLSVAYLQACAQEDDWLQFMIFAQLHNYQPEEVKGLLKDFSPVLQEHLTLAFQNLQYVSQEKPPGCTEVKKESEPTRDLFQVLYKCQESTNPWRYLLSEAVRQHAPVLSVLAACFQEADVLQCLCVWVVMSSDDVTFSEATKHIEDSVECHEWDLRDLSLMWKVLLGRRKSKQLVRGFQLFQKDCPWLYMLEMYELCTEHKRYKEAKLKIQEFQKCLQSLKAEDSGGTQIPVEWMESEASLLLKLMMQQCPTQYELGKLFHLLADVDYSFVTSDKGFCPDFQKLSRLAQLLQETSISIDHSLFDDYSVETLQYVCGKILNQLQKKGLFVLARQVVDLAGLTVDSLLVEEVSQELQNLKQRGQWQRKETRINFWKKCHDCFKNNLISNVVASEFFLCQAMDKSFTNAQPPLPFKEQLLAIQEKCLLLTIAGHWLSSSTPPFLEQLEEVEKRIWLCRISQQTLLMSTASRFAWQVSVCGELTFEDATKEFLFSKLPALNSPKYLKLEGFPNKDMASNCRLEAVEQEALSILIGSLLDGGCIHEASRVSRYFEFYNQDLSLVLHCRALASGEAQVADLHPAIKTILSAGAALNGETRHPRKRISSMGNISSSSVLSLEDNVVKDQVVNDLQVLIDECSHGKSYCHQVLSLFELSKELGFSFNDISTQDSNTVLRKVLSSQQPDRYKKARAFITTQGLKAEAVAALVADEVVQALLSSAQSKGQEMMQVYNPRDGKEAFLQLAKLCQDPILVGMKLLDKISSISAGDLDCTVELLILAHNCFSLTCHMEGIGRVLQAARHLSHKHLAPNEAYSLMVRLITGIGRYNDMTYIFDLLHENHRFEMLLRKNVVSNGGLKAALLDYIKRCLPGDSEKHNMVAFCFSMCREIGENHESAARVQLKLIESQPWEVTPELKKSLAKILSFLKDAAESYSKDSCIRRAAQCVKLAKLVTLQLHFVNNNQNVQLINRQRNDLMTCILSLPRFYQASILAEAYDFIPDWAEVLYQHVIVSGDFAYLEEFKQQHQLQPSLFEEISTKFKQHKGDAGASQNLKRLLQYCEDVYLFYKMAYEHNFTDVANKLLKEPQTRCYLKDSIAS